MGLVIPPSSLQKETAAVNAIGRGFITVSFFIPHDKIKINVVDWDFELACVVLLGSSKEGLKRK